MSRIWEAPRRIEQQGEDGVSEFIVPDRIPLTPKQRRAVEVLLQTDSVGDAARRIGIAEVTLRRWLTRPGFIAAYYRAGREQLDRERARLDQARQNAVEVLRRARELLTRVNDVATGLRRLGPAAADEKEVRG